MGLEARRALAPLLRECFGSLLVAVCHYAVYQCISFPVAENEKQVYCKLSRGLRVPHISTGADVSDNCSLPHAGNYRYLCMVYLRYHFRFLPARRNKDQGAYAILQLVRNDDKIKYPSSLVLFLFCFEVKVSK